MTNDKLIKLATGNSRKATVWAPCEMLLSELYTKLSTPIRTAERYSDYMGWSKAQQDAIKDIGGFVGGELVGSRRKSNAVKLRSLATLDLDHIPADGKDVILRRVDGLGCGYCVYSTRKHSDAAPRLRVVIPLCRDCTADEYEPLTRKLAEHIGMECCDPTTFEASRLMYWPSCSADSTYVYTFADRPMLDVDAMLSMYTDWRDVQEWAGLTAPKLPNSKQQADPTEKSGIVGAFCRVYDVPRAISELLPGIYIPCGKDRYTYAAGSTTGGAVTYDDGKFLYSHHATDPAGGKLCNAFDLVRLHLYGDKDEDCKPDTPANRLPSYTEMSRFAAQDNDVAGLLYAERRESAGEVFGMTDDAPDPDWYQQLKRTGDGAYAKTINNVLLILEGDPSLRGKVQYDEFSNRVSVLGGLPWDSSKNTRIWSDNDDAGIRHYIEQAYGISGKERIYDACSLSSHKHHINAVRDYINALPMWDGVPRLDTLFIDYLGAEDTPYNRAVARKSFTAAIARALCPGVKYDYMPILTGPQGIGKSTLLRLLGADWFSDSLETFEGKEACEMLQGVWVNEIGELSSLTRSEVNSVKQFLSKTEDIFREPYGRRTGIYPRRCVFFGTTNDTEFLRDQTGNRRFWPVDCGVSKQRKDVFADLENEVGQLWAEAYVAWQLGEPLYLTGELEQAAVAAQEAHSETDTREGVIRDFIARKVPADWTKRTISQRRMYWANEFGRAHDGEVLVARDRICAAEVWCEALDGDLRTIRRADTAAINAVLDKLDGWHRSKNGVQIGGEYGFIRGYTHD